MKINAVIFLFNFLVLLVFGNKLTFQHEPVNNYAPSTKACHFILPGALIQPYHYSALASALPSSVILSFPFNLALFQIAEKIEAAYKNLRDGGVACDDLFLVGHSLGANAVQDFMVKSNSEIKSKVKGVVFLGSCLQRKYNGTEGMTNYFSVPFLCISGELDGIHRSVRLAEKFYHFSYKNMNFPFRHSFVLTVPGMNHMQFTSLSSTFVTKTLDLKPEISTEDALRHVSSYINAFVEFVLFKTSQSENVLKQAETETEDLLKPLLEALFMEANGFIKKPCNSDNPSLHCPYYPAWPLQPNGRNPSNDTDCFCGNPWASYAMAGLDSSKFPVYSVDAMHDVTDMNPFHHAYIWKNCSQSAEIPCIMNLTTVSQNMYDSMEYMLESGFSHSTAYEIRVKMKSRQLYRQNSVDNFAKFAVDDINICAEINRFAYAWALSKASEKARKRFEDFGTKPTFLDDFHFFIPQGQWWGWKALKLKVETDKSGERSLHVQAVSMKTEIDSWINKIHPDSGGQHYCKLLSPARIMEWIYSEGLRNKYGV